MLRHFSTYLFDEKTVLVTDWTRGMTEPRDVSTLDLPGPRFGQVPLFVLTSERTFSAAESFAFAMKINQRATLVGETTGGGGHYGGTVPLVDGFTLWLPHGRAYDRRTGKGFEAEGIEPHIAVPADQALERALIEARQAARRRAAKREADEAAVNRMGYEALNDGLHGLAIVIFRRNVEQFPGSSNVYDSLGEAYMRAGDTELAVSNYERSLELDPGNENARDQLERLRR